MAIRKYKPTTPGRRGSSVADFAEITRSTPEKSLLRPLSKTGGRNNQGRITTRHIGGGHKRQYRVIDFRRNDKDGVERQGRSHRVRPQPHRAHRAAALRRTARSATSSRRTSCRRATSSSRVPAPTSSPATTCRCATSPPVPSSTPSSSAPVAARRWPARPAPRCASSPRTAPTPSCVCPRARSATSTRAAARPIGEVGNAEQSNINWGKAGRKRWKGVRPTVRGVAMNPVDHPHGGGEGKTSGGRHPVSPVGPEGRPHPSRQQGERQAHRPSSHRRQEAQVGVEEDATQSQEGPLRRRPPASQGRRRRTRPVPRTSSRPGRVAR